MVGLAELRRGEAKTSKPDTTPRSASRTRTARSPSPAARVPRRHAQGRQGPPHRRGDHRHTRSSRATSGASTSASPATRSPGWPRASSTFPTMRIRWMDATITQMPMDRIKGRDTSHSRGARRSCLAGHARMPSFTVHDLPKGKELKYARRAAMRSARCCPTSPSRMSPRPQPSTSTAQAAASPVPTPSSAPSTGWWSPSRLAERTARPGPSSRACSEAARRGHASPRPTRPEASPTLRRAAPEKKPGEKSADDLKKEVDGPQRPLRQVGLRDPEVQGRRPPTRRCPT